MYINVIFILKTIVTDGRGIVTTNGISSEVKKGDIYLSLPCDVHRIETDPNELLKYDFFAFTAKEHPFQEEFERIAQDYYSPNTRIFHDERIRPLISNAIAELNAEDLYSKELLTSLFRQILLYVIRSFQEIPPKTQSENISRSEILCFKLMNYIDTHIYSMKNLNELSIVTDYSYGYLSALFKKTTSRTLSDYYYKKKLDAAQLLLLENKLTITEISELLNYSSPYAFSKAFTKQFGISPRSFQKNMHYKNL